MDAIGRSLAGYPGRGLFAFRSKQDVQVFVGYFITGRSPASRQRTLAWDGARLVVDSSTVPGTPDPLRHYVAGTCSPSGLILGNGEHVLQIADQVEAGVEFGSSGARLRHEPDGPIFTPRITVEASSHGTVEFLSHRAVLDDGIEIPERRHYRIGSPSLGRLYVMTTYRGMDDDVPRAAGRLEILDLEPSFVVSALWEALAAESRVAMVVFAVDSTGVALVATFGAVADDPERSPPR